MGLSLVSTIIIGSKQGPIIFFLLQFTYFNSGTVFMYTLIIPKKTGKDEEIHKCYFVPPDVKNVFVDKY